MKTLKNRIDKLTPPAPQPPRYMARIYDGMDRPVILTITTDEDEQRLEFPDESALDSYTKAEGISPLKIRRILVVSPNSQQNENTQ